MSTHGTTPEHDDGPSLPGATYDKRPVRGDPAGWYPDPEARATLRYWAGRDWYEDADHQPVRHERPASEPLPRRISLRLQLGCLLPLAGAVALPLLVMRWLEPPGGVGPLGAWERAVWAGVILGWVLWATALIVWKGTEGSYAEALHRSYESAAVWHSTCLGLTIAVAVLGALGTVGALLVLTLAAALGGVGAGL